MKTKAFTVSIVRDLEAKLNREEITYSRFVERLNEIAYEWYYGGINHAGHIARQTWKITGNGTLNSFASPEYYKVMRDVILEGAKAASSVMAARRMRVINKKNMEQVRAKFVVTSIEEFQGGNKKVNFACQYSHGKPEDNTFAAATPVGSATLTINNPAAADFFKVGESVFADFSKAQ